MKALILTADNFEDTELLVPFYRLREAGYDVEIASLARGPLRGIHGYEVTAQKSFEEVRPDDYAVLVVPGGKAPAAIRADARVQEIARAFMASGRPVAAICHGPQVLISAGLVAGRRATCYRGVAEELREAGGRYEDSEVVIDGNLITSRHPADLPAFLRELMRLLPADPTRYRK
jgi:protease I